LVPSQGSLPATIATSGRAQERVGRSLAVTPSVSDSFGLVAQSALLALSIRKVGSLDFGGHRGKNRVKFQGRISRRKTLKPGHHRLTATAKSVGAVSKPRSLNFVIVR
jgi:hypothetical protein